MTPFTGPLSPDGGFRKDVIVVWVAGITFFSPLGVDRFGAVISASSSRSGHI